MEWSDQALIIGVEKYNEESAVMSCLTAKRGLCRGFIKSVKNKNNQKAIFIGNIVQLSWSARLEQHLGSWRILSHESLTPYFYHDRKKLAVVSSICALINSILAEQEAHDRLFEEVVKFLHAIKHDDDWLRKLVFLEMTLLGYIGCGLDLSECAVSKEQENLVYISPSTGRAVSKEAGRTYHDKLFLLPQFLISDDQTKPSLAELLYALNVTKYFFTKFMKAQKNLSIPKIRIMLEDILKE